MKCKVRRSYDGRISVDVFVWRTKLGNLDLRREVISIDLKVNDGYFHDDAIARLRVSEHMSPSDALLLIEPLKTAAELAAIWESRSEGDRKTWTEDMVAKLIPLVTEADEKAYDEEREAERKESQKARAQAEEARQAKTEADLKVYEAKRDPVFAKLKKLGFETSGNGSMSRTLEKLVRPRWSWRHTEDTKLTVTVNARQARHDDTQLILTVETNQYRGREMEYAAQTLFAALEKRFGIK